MPRKEPFYALKDINFDIYPGETVGIIGRNGAGKSTLLKILSRITPPTTGSIKLRGRVASLLEVGTGFHPELTGRENVYFNGAILGLKKHEIQKKFDEIVDFSGVETFLDTPLKKYSSGMQLRLAFAVAAHLDPEILLVDEVLSVGDAEFQKKCLGKMESVSKGEGRTVVVVSHDLGMVERLCEKGILLENGKLSEFTHIKNILINYLNNDFRVVINNKYSTYISSIKFLNSIKNNNCLYNNDNCSIEIKIASRKKYNKIEFAIGINRVDGYRVSQLNSRYFNENLNLDEGENIFIINFIKLPLIESIYSLSVEIESYNSIIYYEKNIAWFNVIDNNYFPIKLTTNFKYSNIHINHNFNKLNNVKKI